MKSAPRLGLYALATLMILGSSIPSRAESASEEWKAPARAARKKNPIPADEASVAAGKEIYAKECLACHGPKGRGDGPTAKDMDKAPTDLSRPVMWQQSDGALFWKITEGRKPMPSFAHSLTEDQRWQVVNFIRTLAAKPADAPANP